MVTHKYEQKILYRTINDIFQHDNETHAVVSRGYHSGTTVNYAKSSYNIVMFKDIEQCIFEGRLLTPQSCG